MSWNVMDAFSSDDSEQMRKKILLGVAVGLLVLAAVVFFWRMRGESRAVLPATTVLPVADGYTILCQSCKTSFELKRDQFQDAPYKCPKCGSTKTTPDNTKLTPMVDVPGG